jgi:hypothetical protein
VTIAHTSRRPAGSDPGEHLVRRIVVWSLAAVGLASFAVSFTALVTVASWASVPEVLTPAVPVFIDGALVVCALLWAVQRSRGRAGRTELGAALFFTGVSMLANAAHALASGGTGDLRTWAGACVAAMAPAAVLVSTHFVIDVLMAPEQKAADRAAAARSVDETRAAAQARAQARVTRRAGAPKAALVARVHSLHAEQVSNREIARRTGLSRDTVAVYLAQARAGEDRAAG